MYKERMDRMPMDLDSWCLNMPAPVPDTDQATAFVGREGQRWGHNRMKPDHGLVFLGMSYSPNSDNIW